MKRPTLGWAEGREGAGATGSPFLSRLLLAKAALPLSELYGPPVVTSPHLLGGGGSHLLDGGGVDEKEEVLRGNGEGWVNGGGRGSERKGGGHAWRSGGGLLRGRVGEGNGGRDNDLGGRKEGGG